MATVVFFLETWTAAKVKRILDGRHPALMSARTRLTGMFIR